MSIKVMHDVWERAEQEGGSLLVLLALADYADDHGCCWPDRASVAKKARLTERQTTNVIAQLVNDGDLLFVPGRGRGKRSCYCVLVGATATERSEREKSFREMISSFAEKGKSVTRKGEICDTEKGKFDALSRVGLEHREASNPSPIRHVDPLENPLEGEHASRKRSARPSDEKSKEPKSPPAIRQALADECKIDLAIATREQKLQVNQSAGILWKAAQKAGTSEDDVVTAIRDVARYCRKNAWECKKEQLTPAVLRAYWRQAIDARNTERARYHQPAPGTSTPASVAPAAPTAPQPRPMNSLGYERSKVDERIYLQRQGRGEPVPPLDECNWTVRRWADQEPAQMGVTA